MMIALTSDLSEFCTPAPRYGAAAQGVALGLAAGSVVGVAGSSGGPGVLWEAAPPAWGRRDAVAVGGAHEAWAGPDAERSHDSRGSMPEITGWGAGDASGAVAPDEAWHAGPGPAQGAARDALWSVSGETVQGGMVGGAPGHASTPPASPIDHFPASGFSEHDFGGQGFSGLAPAGPGLTGGWPPATTGRATSLSGPARPGPARPDCAQPDRAWPDPVWPDPAQPDPARPGLAVTDPARPDPAPLLWVHPAGWDRPLSAAGLAAYGIDPGRVVLVRTRSVVSGLQAALDAAREEGSGLGAILIDLPGDARDYDLSASRRLRLAARETGVPVLVCRIGADPGPSAARTRWLVRPAPSRPLGGRRRDGLRRHAGDSAWGEAGGEAGGDAGGAARGGTGGRPGTVGLSAPGAPGAPCFDLTLLKSEDGRSGLSIRVEWNRDDHRFLVVDAPAGSQVLPAIPVVAAPGDRGWPAPLPGAVVPLPGRRTEPGARPGPHPGPDWRRTG